MDESNLRDSDIVMQTYATYIDKGESAEEMIFCESLDSTTTASDTYDKFKK